MRKKSLLKEINLIFLISVGVPFVISILCARPFIEYLIYNNSRTTTALTLQSMANHIDSYIDNCSNYFSQSLFDENLSRFYSYVNRHDIRTEDKEAYFDYYKISKEYRNSLIRYSVSLNQEIREISLVPENRNQSSIFCFRKGSNTVENLKLADTAYKDMYERIKKEPPYRLLIEPSQENPEDAFVAARRINNIEQNKRQAVIFLNISTDIFRTVVNNFRSGKSAVVIISYPDGSQAYSSSERIGRMYNRINDKAQLRESGNVTLDQKYYITSICSENGFPIDYIVPRQTILNEVNKIFSIFILVWCLAILLAFILYRRFSQRVTVAAGRIMRFIHSYWPDKRKTDLEPDGSYIIEFDNISLALTDMKERIETLVEKEYLLKLNQQAAEYKALQTEINPHFLNNVLSSLLALNRINEKKHLETAILNLSKMFRYTAEHEYDTALQEECRFIESYLMLEKLRFESKLAYKIELDQDIESLQIPKLLLQPIVENAMKHGFLDGCEMEIRIAGISFSEAGGSWVWIFVANNGIPLDRKSLEQGAGIGVKNVKARLYAAYPNSVMWYSASEKYQTICNILIAGPLKRADRGTS